MKIILINLAVKNIQKFKIYGVVFLAAAFFHTPAVAAPCSSSQIGSYANSLANRDNAFLELNIAKQNLQLEQENQARITAAMEQQIQLTLSFANSYLPIIRNPIINVLQQLITRRRSTRVREESSKIASANRVIKSAQTKFDSAFKVAARPLSCDLCEGTYCVAPTPTPTPTPFPTPRPSVTPTPVPTSVPATILLQGQNIRTGQIAKNGQTLSCLVGDSIQYQWSTPYATNGTSTYRISSGPNNCNWANPGVWEATMGGGGGDLATVQACQKGTTYEISYKPTNAAGALMGEQKLYVSVN